VGSAVKCPGLDEISLLPVNVVVEEPDHKRARFADSTDSKISHSMEVAQGDEAEEDEDEEDGDEEDGDEEDKAPPYTRWAEEVTTIRMIKGGANGGAENEAGRFAPSYTHQVFYNERGSGDNVEDRADQELIIGYEDPELEITYAANSLKAYFEFRHSAQVAVKLLKQNNLTRTSTLNSLHSRVPMDYATKLSEVQDEANAPFTPVGALHDQEELPDGSLLQIFHFTVESPEAVQFVRRMQTFAIWMIETGSVLEVPDRRWNVLTLYRVETGSNNQDVHTLLGFCTAYRFWVYDKVTNLLSKEGHCAR
jgi:hypothetical protein